MKKSLLVIVGLMFLIVILGAVPTLNDVSLTPSSPLTNQNLTGSINATMDGKNMSYVYNWYKNGALNATTLIFEGLESYYPL